jgi:hypothetical protein
MNPEIDPYAEIEWRAWAHDKRDRVRLQPRREHP